MDPVKFDALTRLIETRASRRSAITKGAAGLAAVAGLRAIRPATAQEATPAPFPDDPHPSAGTDPTSTEFLFTQSFQSGTWAPKAGEEDVYTLTLSDVPSQIVYFSDRPQRIFGTVATQPFLDGLGFTPANPPNAALIAQLEPGSADEEVLVIELLNPVYDPDTATMTYDAKILADYSGHGLAHAAHKQSDYSLPAEFAHGSLFIDDCPANQVVCNLDANTTCGSVWAEMCWNPSFGICALCDDPVVICKEAFPECLGQ